jgi:E3 ubiquitin-protein ligase NEDD4
MLTLDLKKSNGNDVISGKLIFNLSTNVNAPIRNGTNTLAPNTANRASVNASGTSLAVRPERNSVQSSSAPPSSLPLTNSLANQVPAGQPSASSTSHSAQTDLPPGYAKLLLKMSSLTIVLTNIFFSWERRTDHLGRPYYVDHNTRTTTWNRPEYVNFK